MLTLREYLLRHESDIALSLDDYGDLRSAFQVFLGREPKP
jgi:hypothetical protein